TTPFLVREAITAVPSSATAVVALVPGTRTAAPPTSANALCPRLNTITSPPAATVSAVRAGGSSGTSTPPHALGASVAITSRQVRLRCISNPDTPTQSDSPEGSLTHASWRTGRPGRMPGQ